MFKKTTLTFLVLMGILAFTALAKRSHREFSEARPLSKAELLALVAGDSLPENITYEIRTHGLRFAPTDGFKGLLSNAGAAAQVLAEVDKANVSETESYIADDSPLLEHLSAAGKMIRAQRYL